MALDLPGLAFAFTSGVLALFSPCAYPLLPGYVLYYMGTEAPAERVLWGGLTCTLGLLAVFSTIGATVSVLGGIVSPYITLLQLASGLTLIVLGVGILVKKRLSAFTLPIRAPRQRGLLGIFFYGVAYGLATLGCSAPLFLSILFYAITRGGVLDGVAVFIVYAAGMGLPLILTTILVAKAKQLTLGKIVKVMPWLQRISGAILVVIGAYLVASFYYTGS